MHSHLKTSVWIPALIRRAEIGGAFASVLHKGDLDAGAALIKVCLLDGTAMLYRPLQDGYGARKWLPKGPLDEKEIDADISKRKNNDPDLWVIEIEDRKGRHFLTDPIDRA